MAGPGHEFLAGLEQALDLGGHGVERLRQAIGLHRPGGRHAGGHLPATLITCHSDEEGAAPTYKRGFGFHPILGYLDTHGLGPGGLPLAGLLRSGNTGANTAADHVTLLDDALEVLPREIAADAAGLDRFGGMAGVDEFGTRSVWLLEWLWWLE